MRAKVSKDKQSELFAQAAVHLARAFLIAGRPAEAMEEFHAALDHGLSGGLAPHLPLLEEEAERCSLRGDHREAVQRWQDIAALLAEATPARVYEKMSEAYISNTLGFWGSETENQVWGDMGKHEVLAWLHQSFRPSLYLEIGVDEGVSLGCSVGPSIGVDPRPTLRLREQLPAMTRIECKSSDAFFAGLNREIEPAPEMAFIDGMHLLEFVLRDVLNTKRIMPPWGLMVVDDIYPCNPIQAKRRRQSGAWTGDVWKLVPFLREHRPELLLLCLNSNTTGLLLIAGMDSDDADRARAALWANYARLTREQRTVEEPPLAVLQRHRSLPSNHTLVTDLVTILQEARQHRRSVNEVRARLKRLKKGLEEAEQEMSARNKRSGGG